MKFSNRHIWQISYPLLLSLLMEHLINMTDTAFLGHVGEIELGASAIAGVYYIALFIVAFGFSIGAQIIIGRRNGEGNYLEIGPVFRQGMIFLLAAGVVMSVASWFGSPKIFEVLVQSEAIRESAWSFMQWRLFGLIFAYAASMFRAFFVGITQTKILTINALVMVLTNVFLNYVLVFGKLGLPALGIVGSGIASSVAEFVSLGFFIIYVYAKVDRRKYGLFWKWHVDLHKLRQILNVTGWTMIQMMISVVTWFLFFIAIEHLGERPLAITNIVRSIASVLFIVGSAFGSATSTLVSNLIGARQERYVMRTVARTTKMAFLLGIPIMVLLAIFPMSVLRVYTDNPDLIAASVPTLRVMITAYLLYIPGLIMFNAVSGTGNTRSALIMEICALAVYVTFVIVVIFRLKADVAICWLSEHVYAIVMLSICTWYMRSGRWRNKRI